MTDALTPVDSLSWLIATAIALVWALAANDSCSLPPLPATSIVVGVAPMPEAVKGLEHRRIAIRGVAQLEHPARAETGA
jgi:hypothetical protein